MSKFGPNYVDCVQGTAEWLKARTGLVTASRVADVVNKQRNGKYYAARENYKMELLTEILTGLACEHYVSPAMDYGAVNEPLARTTYEFQREIEVEQVGFFKHPRIERAGASPDGMIGTDGLVEIKVPNTKTHLEYLLGGEVPELYKPQMLWEMACTGRQYCDFVSYDPRMPEEFGLFVIRFERDNERIAEMETEVEKFIAEIGELCIGLQRFKAEHPMRVSESEDSGIPESELPDVEAWLGHE